MIEVLKTDKYSDWFDGLTKKEHFKVDARIIRLEIYEHFGNVKYLSGGLSELRWKNGWRVYFSMLEHNKIILIIGGNKNEQKKDIKKARIFINKHSAH